MTFKGRLFRFFGLPPSLLDLADTGYGLVTGSLVSYTGFVSTGAGEANLFGGDCTIISQGLNPPTIECDGNSGFTYVQSATEFHGNVFFLLLLGTLIVLLFSVAFAHIIFWMRRSLVSRPLEDGKPISKVYYLPLIFLVCTTLLFGEIYELAVYDAFDICVDEFC